MTIWHFLLGGLNLACAAYLGHSTSKLIGLMVRLGWDWQGTLLVVMGILFFILNVFGVYLQWFHF